MIETSLTSLSFFETWRLDSRNRVKMLCNLARKGDFIRLPIGSYFFNRPEAVVHVLQTHADYFQKKKTPYDLMMEVLGPGVLTEDGQAWAAARSQLQGQFTSAHLAKRLASAQPLVLSHIQRWQQSSVFDIKPALHHLLTDLMLYVLCDYSHPELIASANEAIAMANYEVSRISPFTRPIQKRRKLQTVLSRFHRAIHHHAPHFSAQGILGPLITPFQKGQLSAKCFMGEMKNFLIAGAETTASTLAWLVHLTTTHPEYLAQMIAEIRQTSPPDSWTSPSLPYTQMCLEETLRLYPSIWTILRFSHRSSQLANIHIERNRIIFLSPYTLGRHPEFWQFPEYFQPEHFTPQEKAKRPKGVYIPFGMGKRVCIGKQLAMASMKMILYEWLNRADLSPIDPQFPGINPLVTLQPKKPIWVLSTSLKT